MDISPQPALAALPSDTSADPPAAAPSPAAHTLRSRLGQCFEVEKRVECWPQRRAERGWEGVVHLVLKRDVAAKLVEMLLKLLPSLHVHALDSHKLLPQVVDGLEQHH
eukprot:960727-Rhodomonas_salina.1